MIQWLIALHVTAVVCWFAGLFYLPRLYVYHSLTSDKPGIERFRVMEFKLYYYITWPSAIITTVSGHFLITLNESIKHVNFLDQRWMQLKLLCVLLLWIFHLYCGYVLKKLKHEKPKKDKFYRIMNEIPTVLLIAIMILAFVKPFQ